MNFYDVLNEVDVGLAYNPYAGRTSNGDFLEGVISIDWLNKHFGEYNNATDMISKAESFGLELTVFYFEWLVEEGKLKLN